MHKASDLLSSRVRTASPIWVQVKQKKACYVLGRAGVGVILFIFKLSSAHLPGTGALLELGNRRT